MSAIGKQLVSTVVCHLTSDTFIGIVTIIFLRYQIFFALSINNRNSIFFFSVTVCLGRNHHVMLGSQIKACNPPKNDLKSGQRHRNDLSV